MGDNEQRIEDLLEERVRIASEVDMRTALGDFNRVGDIGIRICEIDEEVKDLRNVEDGA